MIIRKEHKALYGFIFLNICETAMYYQSATLTYQGAIINCRQYYDRGDMAEVKDLQSKSINFINRCVTPDTPFWLKISNKRRETCALKCVAENGNINCDEIPYENYRYGYFCVSEGRIDANQDQLCKLNFTNESFANISIDVERDDRKCNSGDQPLNMGGCKLNELEHSQPCVTFNHTIEHLRVYENGGDTIYIIIFDMMSPTYVENVCKYLQTDLVLSNESKIRNQIKTCSLNLTSFIAGPVLQRTDRDGYYCNISADECVHKNNLRNNSFICKTDRQRYRNRNISSFCQNLFNVTTNKAISTTMSLRSTSTIESTTTTNIQSSTQQSTKVNLSTMQTYSYTSSTDSDKMVTSPKSSTMSTPDSSEVTTTTKSSEKSVNIEHGLVIGLVVSYLFCIIGVILWYMYSKRRKTLHTKFDAGNTLPNNYTSEYAVPDNDLGLREHEHVDNGHYCYASDSVNYTQNEAQGSDVYHQSFDDTPGNNTKHRTNLLKNPKTNIYDRAVFHVEKSGVEFDTSLVIDDEPYDHLHGAVRERSIHQQHISDIYQQSNFEKMDKMNTSEKHNNKPTSDGDYDYAHRH